MIPKLILQSTTYFISGKESIKTFTDNVVFVIPNVAGKVRGLERITDDLTVARNLGIATVTIGHIPNTNILHIIFFISYITF